MVYYELTTCNIIHIPKTGGRFNLFACVKATEHRGYVVDEKPGLPDNGKPTLVMVREPENWYPSFWAYDKSLMRDHNFPTVFLDEIMALYDEDFDVFTQNVIDNGNGFLKRFFGQYLPYATTIGHTENIKDDLVNFLRASGEDFNEQVIRDMGYVNKGYGVPMVKEELIQPLRDKEAL